MKPKDYGNPANRNEETPEKLLPLAGEAAFRAFLIGQKITLAKGLTRPESQVQPCAIEIEDKRTRMSIVKIGKS